MAHFHTREIIVTCLAAWGVGEKRRKSKVFSGTESGLCGLLVPGKAGRRKGTCGGLGGTSLVAQCH